MSAKPRVRTVTACKIARVDAAKFNDVVSRGVYRCAPDTTPGSVRSFDEAALLPLYFFARLLDWNISAPWAASMACDMAERILKYEKTQPIDSIVVLFGEREPVAFGGVHPTLVEWMPEADYNREKDTLDFSQTIGFNVVVRLVFEIKTVRAIIADMLQHEINQFLAGKSGPL